MTTPSAVARPTRARVPDRPANDACSRYDRASVAVRERLPGSVRAVVLATVTIAFAFGCAAGKGTRPPATEPLAIGEAVADRWIERRPARRLRFSWGPAVLLYGMGELAEVSPRRGASYRGYVAAFHRDHRSPRIRRPDHCAPAIAASDAAGTIARAHAYLKSEPRNHLGAIDHLGDGALAVFYPRSIWVDSLMAYALAAAVVADARDDPRMLDFAFAQPRIFATRLQDPSTGLFRHAWLVEREHSRPRGDVFWARGNGWAALAIVDLLERMPPEHPERPMLERIFVHLANGLVANRRTDGRWSTVLGDDTTYAEPSATLLVAYALAKGARLGLLPTAHADIARQAYRAVVQRLDGLRLTGISRATIPARGRAGYARVPRGTDLSYGVGALLLASAELARH